MLLAAFDVLVSRYTGQEDIVVGSPLNGRTRPEFEGVFGYFVNPVPIRTDLSGNPTFRGFLARVRQVVLDALDHQDYPSARLVAELPLRRDSSRSPLFQVLFVLDKPHKVQTGVSPFVLGETGTRMDLGGLVLQPYPLEQQAAMLDLVVMLVEAWGALSASLQYNADLFDPATMERLAVHYRVLLEGIAADPDRLVSELPLLDAPEQRQVLIDWNGSRADHPRDCCIPQLFEEQVQRTPTAIALVSGDERLTYAELNARANQLLHHLRSLGIGPEMLVGVFVERSAQLLIGVLGVLKAGAAYVPLDPVHARERLASLITDGRLAALITQESLLPDVPPTAMPLICVDRDAEMIRRQPDVNPTVAAKPDNLAYVIFTSGSTGTPKGVMIPHRNLASIYRSWEEAYALRSACTSHLQMASASFDVFTGDWVRALCSGGKLVLCPREVLLDPARLLGLMQAERVDVAEFVPAVLRPLTRHVAEVGQRFDFMRVLIVGSDSWHARDHREVSKLCGPRTRFIDSYGLTEVTIDSTFFEGTTEDLPPDGIVPIGKPFSNAQVYVLDANFQPVPIGIPGELYLGGPGVARGYSGQPALTAERFIPNPFSPIPGGRLYRTGDRARWLPAGNLEFLGRSDTQVKVRGYRIELGEIEQVLGRHPSIREAVVLAREDRPGDRRLVAYVTTQPGASLTLREVRDSVGEHLPEYMAPSALVVMDAWPLSSSGKIDRRSLPAPETGPSESYVPPRTEMEARLAAIFAEVMGRDNIGALDNFFELGGHSLQAVQLVARINAALSPKFSIRDVFRTPTVAGMAEVLDGLLEQHPGSTMQRIPRRPEGEVIPLSFAQQRLWFLTQLEPNSPAYNMAGALAVTGPLNVPALERSLNEIVRRHEVCRTTFVAVDGLPRQVIAPSWTLTLPKVDLRPLAPSDREAEVRRLMLEESALPFDLTQLPLLRGRLLQLDEQQHVLLVTMHHVISDGWSLGVFIRELGSLYLAFVSGRTSPLPELTIQYADFAHWQRQWLKGEVLQGQIDYWKQQMVGAPAALALPTDRPRPAVQTFRGSTHSFTLPASLTASLQALSQREGATLFMTLLAAFQTLLSRYSGEDDIVVGSPIAGRNRADVEGLIGFFVNTLALRTDLSGNPSFRELLQRVREVCLGAYAHQDLPFERLVDELQLPRDLGRNPLVQVVFSMDNAPLAALELPGLTVQTIPGAAPVAKFDLSLAVADGPAGLAASLEYNTDLFDPTTVERLAEHFHTLLEGIVADPDGHLAELPLLTEAERRMILLDWNATATEYPDAHGFHQLFEAQAWATPEVVALEKDGEQLSYRELNQRANLLAHRLCSLGVGPEVVVAICMERSLEMLVGVLGILKAGGAYLPLDPEYPQHRLEYMLQDSGTKLLLTQEKFSVLSSQLSVKKLFLSELRTENSERRTIDEPCRTKPDHPAYVIYTSGSTGRPKGAILTHRGLCNLTAATRQFLRFGPGDRVLQFASFSFDAATWDVVATLTCGAALVLADSPALLPGQPLWNTLHERAITCVTLPPSALAMLPTQPLPALKTLVAGGEACPAGLVDLWSPGRGFFNAYGPTEVTVDATVGRCVSTNRLPAIGKPIANVRAYVLDPDLEPVPVGVAGELYLAGPGLARGYLGRPALTAERFLPCPFPPTIPDEPPGLSRREGRRDKPGGEAQAGLPAGAHPGVREAVGERMYRTGDLVRWTVAGELEYLGRIDHQVKLRGYRIELGEIEAVLDRHPGVAQAMVVVREDRPGERRLVAYLVARDRVALTPAELRPFLQAELPGYMVPAAFVVLDRMPLTPSGKVDRRALPAPEAGPVGEHVPPRTDLEAKLSAIWAEVLCREVVSIHDNFFEVGGHSLKVVQAATRMSAALGREVPMQLLFLHPTIAALAEAIEQAQADVAKADNLDLAPEAVLDPEITVDGAEPARTGEPKEMLLTGATGFLGAFLLRDLLDQTQAKVHCLIRASDPAAGGRKLRTHLETLGLWEEAFAERIVPIPGDLAEPRLGLSEEDFDRLARTIDVIYHNGALVNMVYAYPALKAANVLGTQEVLRLACRRRIKPVHYVSTLSVFPAVATEQEVLREEEAPDCWKDLEDGYSQSKWVAEKLVIEAGRRGLPVSIYRPGRITGHSRTGAHGPNDMLAGILRDLVTLGTVPDVDVLLDLTPVDYVSAAIVHLSRKEARGGIFHLTNPDHVSLRHVVGVLERSGYPVRLQPYAEWYAGLLNRNGSNGALGAGLTMLLGLGGTGARQVLQTLQYRHFECGKTLAALADSEIRCPAGDDRLLETYLGYLSRTGLLPPKQRLVRAEEEKE